MERLRRLLALRPGEGRPVGLAVAVAFCTSAGLMIAQSGIEGLFFARGGVEQLPVLYLALGGTMVVVMVGIGVLVTRVGRGRACLLLPLATALLATAGRLVLATGVTWIYPVLWLLQGASFFVLGLAVWGLAGVVTDTRQAKRFFPLIGAAGVLGQVVGGLITRPLADLLGTANLLWIWVATLLAAAWFGWQLIAGAGAVRIGRNGERDADPIEQLREGFRYVRRSALLRWMSVGAILFSLLYFSLYLPFNRAAVARYPDADDLAGFFGNFYALATAVAFLLSIAVTNRLFARFGVPRLMLVLPVLYVAAFGVLAITPTFALLLVFRFVQVAWIQGGASSAWESVTNVVPVERRDQARAFIYGGPTQAGTIVAGLVALVGERALSPSFLFGAGFVCAILTVVAMARVRRAYVRELVQALREGRPRIFDTGGGNDPFGLARKDASAVGLAVAGLADPDPRVRTVCADSLGDLVDDGASAALRAALTDDDPEVRASALRALARSASTAARPDVLARFSDPDATVRAAALDAARTLGPTDPRARDGARASLHDPDPLVRAQAAGLLASGAADHDVRAELDELDELANAPDPDVRRAALRAMRGLDDAETLVVALGALQDPIAGVREEAAETLGVIGSPAVAPVIRALATGDRPDGALAALERLPVDERDREEVRRFAIGTIARAVERHDIASAIDGSGDERLALLKDSLRHRSQLDALAGLRAASVLEDRGAMAVALDSVSVTDPLQRANALEVIESIGERDVVAPLLSMWETPDQPASDPHLERLADDPDDWIRACADLAHAPNEGAPMTKTLDGIPLMERVLFLRKVPLFAELPPPDLQPIARIVEEHAFDDGEAFAQQGEPGDVMYIIVSGEVAVVIGGDAGERDVAIRSSGEVVGEMAVITSQPRMASLVARGPVRVLSIERRGFESILRERPGTALGVIQVLCDRLAEPATYGGPSAA